MEEKKPKKNYFVRGLIALACAIVLGGVAGATCYGVSTLGYTIFPLNVVENTGTTEASTSQNDATTGSEAVTTTTDGDSQAVTVAATTTVYDVSDMVDSVISSVVAISGTITTETYNMWGYGYSTYESEASGSGIIIGTNDTELLIVTNAHVVEDLDEPNVTFYDGSEVTAVIKGIKSNYDLAVLAINLSDIPDEAIYTIATLGESSDLKVGQAAIAIGNAMGYGISVTTGCISALDKTVTVDSVDYEHLIQTDAAINPGNSGGALFNSEGEVIGINSVKMSNTSVEGMGYAISVSSVLDIIEDLSLQETRIALSDEERGYLGITGVTITSSISQSYGYPEGILIRTVTENCGAANAGLMKNDIISSFDGETITSYEQLVEMMSYYAIGEEVEVVYYRMNNQGEYEKATTTVTLTARPEE